MADAASIYDEFGPPEPTPSRSAPSASPIGCVMGIDPSSL